MPFRARIGGVLRGTVVRGWHDNLSDCAAALTYYSVLALLPALLVAVSLFGLAGTPTRERLVSDLTSYLPPQSAQVLQEALAGLVSSQSSTWALLISGLLSALWSASSYLAVFRRALHTMHRVPDSRPPLRTAHTIVLTALTLLALLLAGAALLLLSAPAARKLSQLLGHDTSGAWAVARWPALLLVVTALVLVLFRTGPRLSPGRTRRGLPGGVLAAVLWLTASFLFTLYSQSGLGTYSRVYGSLAGIVVFLIWLWLGNLSLLIGAQFNAELQRRSPAAAAPEPLGAVPGSLPAAPGRSPGPWARAARARGTKARAARGLRP
ncbi:YihY/virulence factor BrkB family protein [Streptomyces sp. H27-S2]|uniref:YihY/virulence factor BrkB family protein n=1 Tax=Streptomyces TaxID=1883 RepID=UPI002271C589|nr:YihY/virulence factor BrkB family protein [Streptomyces sp. H27-S2]MCY0954735.1 YihY/virulence factor BrkB family protein [Streptomyces sp. H27-S2]